MRVTRYTLQIVLGMCFLLPGSLQAAIYWVGDSAACIGSNVRPNVPAALLAAQLSPEADEIRLTRTLDYENTVHSNITISDWNPSIRGALTLSGGYADCFTAQSGLTVIGDDPDTILIVSTSSQPSSVVRIKNIELTASGGSGLHASGGAEVTLDGVLIRENKNGVVVGTGAYVDVLSNSLIGANGTTSAIPSFKATT